MVGRGALLIVGAAYTTSIGELRRTRTVPKRSTPCQVAVQALHLHTDCAGANKVPLDMTNLQFSGIGAVSHFPCALQFEILDEKDKMQEVEGAAVGPSLPHGGAAGGAVGPMSPALARYFVSQNVFMRGHEEH